MNTAERIAKLERRKLYIKRKYGQRYPDYTSRQIQSIESEIENLRRLLI